MRNLLRLWRSEEGSVMPVIGVLVVALLGSSGAAIDTGRGQLVKAKLSSSLDAAGLAAGATVNTATLSDEAEKYLYANFNNYLGATITDFTITPNENNTVFELSATAEVPTTFMKMLGMNTITVGAESEITRASSGLELVMVLDNTGSMSGTKLSDLKTAATDMVNILFGGSASVENLWIGLVPFSQAVNIGASRSSWTTADSFNWGPTSWAGCVDARETSSMDVTDDPPSVATFPKYYWPDDGNNNWSSTSTSSSSSSSYICLNNSNCRCSNYGPCQCTTVGNVETCISCSGSGSGRDCISTVTTTTTSTSYTITSTRTPNKYCPQAVTPMTADKTTILNGITAMVADGQTHIGLGAVWGWRMLSPRWRNLWGGEMDTNALPLDYNTPKMNKAAIIMTDGDNTMLSGYRGAYWYLSDGKLGTTNQTNAELQLDSRLSTVCTSMKNNNIIVYTVSFGTVSSASQTMLRNCASQSDFYFPSPDAATLNSAFKAIGDSLASLRVSR
jgi:Flp pilus assembly protein TadG